MAFFFVYGVFMCEILSVPTEELIDGRKGSGPFVTVAFELNHEAFSCEHLSGTCRPAMNEDSGVVFSVCNNLEHILMKDLHCMIGYT